MSLCMLLLLSALGAPDEVALKTVLSRFHAAAAAADGDTYFGLLAPDAVFLGTDGTERWTKAEFEALYRPYMAGGKGWTFRPTEQHITLGPDGATAWFDEALASEHYGACRGSGVLVKQGDRWLIAQYNLSIPMPNDLAKHFVGIIRAATTKP